MISFYINRCFGFQVDGDADFGDHRDRSKRFAFDYVFDSNANPDFACQEQIYQELGVEVLSGVFKGYNNCVFAYGMTGTGKTYTMMGYDVRNALQGFRGGGLLCGITLNNRNVSFTSLYELCYLLLFCYLNATEHFEPGRHKLL